MESINGKAFEALGPYPIVQAAVALLILSIALLLVWRASRDKAPAREPVPQWLMMGPLHDMMQSVHEVAEQGRQQTDLLRRIDDQMGDLLRQTEMNKSTLEAIRNESRMR
jgi:hypothetical protein